jgi:ATP-dependent RNA helicase DDX3X
MADQLNMNGLSLNDSKHATGMPARSAYIPPHMRNQAGGPPLGMDGAPPGSEMGLGGSAWGNTA